MEMKSLGLTLLVLAYWALHQDIWLWRDARPMAFGFLPVGLAYHAAYTIGIAFLMAFLVKTAWPFELEKEVDGSDD